MVFLQPTEVDLAYAAGIIDGEGSICVARRINKRVRPSYETRVEVGMADEEVILWLYTRFGGTLQRPFHYRKAKWRTCFRWICRGRDSAIFLRKILPHLKLKRIRAEYAITLGEMTRPHVKGLSRNFSEEDKTKQENLALAIRKENSRSNVVKHNATWGVN
jgi:hypothetical protein